MSEREQRKDMRRFQQSVGESLIHLSQSPLLSSCCMPATEPGTGSSESHSMLRVAHSPRRGWKKDSAWGVFEVECSKYSRKSSCCPALCPLPSALASLISQFPGKIGFGCSQVSLTTWLHLFQGVLPSVSCEFLWFLPVALCSG